MPGSMYDDRMPFTYIVSAAEPNSSNAPAENGPPPTTSASPCSGHNLVPSKFPKMTPKFSIK